MKSAAGDLHSSPGAGLYSIPDRAGSVLRAHFGGTVPWTTWSRRPRQRDSLAEPIHLTKFSEAAHEHSRPRARTNCALTQAICSAIVRTPVRNARV